jgi:hypothetical protein
MMHAHCLTQMEKKRWKGEERCKKEIKRVGLMVVTHTCVAS